MQDRRAHARCGVRIEGKLMSPDMAFCVAVVVRNLSEHGALVSVLAPATTVPERVYLWQVQTKTLFECQVQWRNNDRLVGLRFTDISSRSSVRGLLEKAAPTHVATQPWLQTPSVSMSCAAS